MTGWMDHLTIAPIILPMLAGAVMMLIDERQRTLKAVIGMASALTLLGLAVLAMTVADQGAAGVRVYRLGDWPVQFGIVMLINCALGLNTPPVGTTQFIGCAIGGVSVGEVMRSITPFYGALFVALLLVTYVPGFSLWLPHLLMN